jgi:hypothetical protein
MPEHPGLTRSAPDIKREQISATDTTVEDIRLFVRRLKKRWPDLCIDCKSVIKEALN